MIHTSQSSEFKELKLTNNRSNSLIHFWLKRRWEEGGNYSTTIRTSKWVYASRIKPRVKELYGSSTGGCFLFHLSLHITRAFQFSHFANLSFFWQKQSTLLGQHYYQVVCFLDFFEEKEPLRSNKNPECKQPIKIAWKVNTTMRSLVRPWKNWKDCQDLLKAIWRKSYANVYKDCVLPWIHFSIQ